MTQPSYQPTAHVEAAVQRIDDTSATPLERADALVELALDMQKQPRNPQELFDALYLYERAEQLVEGDRLAQARIVAGRGSALRRMPGSGTDELEQALTCFDQALAVLRDAGGDEEVAELDMSRGLVIHALAAAGKGRLQDAISAYQDALRVFTAGAYPREFATLHNNLATAYLSMRLAPEKEGLREAMAVQSFREALTVVSLEQDPSEYAMLQNNLGNALQAMRSSHPWENLARAIEAYDEALKVRTQYDTPVEFANTIANKANALMNLPDIPDAPERGNPENLRKAAALLREAGQVFASNHVPDRAQIVDELAEQLERELS